MGQALSGRDCIRGHRQSLLSNVLRIMHRHLREYYKRLYSNARFMHNGFF